MTVAENPHFPLPRNDGIYQLWQIGPIEIYEALVYPTGESLAGTIGAKVREYRKTLILFTNLVIILGLIVTIASVLIIKREDKIMKFSLKLLLRVPFTVLFTNKRVMELLGGNYDLQMEDSTEKTLEFHNEVVNRLNDVVIVCNSESNKIITVNAAFEEMFGIKQEEAEGMDIVDFFNEKRFESDEKVSKVFRSTANLIYTNKQGIKIYLEFSQSTVSGRRIFSGRDQTQNVLHEKLIEEEKKKSDAMLASILPAMLVPRVQAGEKNISFSVQSATVLFLDVVEFTPWCGSHDAQYVMCMLNIMFKEFDAITNAHKTMTKIKCIGDCYMAAGGIFDEVNQPAVHAKEVVDFGCLVIKKLLDIDEKENEKLRIRVGINTGGPIVAGVIGTEKPTFEILGPAINIAHEMENKGVPMKVHISRPVYELIYGQQFDIKERGEIDVKGGKMFTYLVEP
ncbi:Adenylate and Guanylate cyclase catalytic domain containing protein [Trichomonas vaginalis G3]|uniref:Adenylate and Guanylate cyclase catalytic domain containing protein n=2 Tax=Trichomonas vaginalis (strain ATCC PRA-98 / G3) TaxID=412133 RepID=A2FZG5_TRIV3|nr:guanylate cyclase protein [Trichomonas vaginalis G3]EAX89697.1 Adenylate and Guanylate cyclase catalytic domain containing protein [Trichomonas vaginalis G3]KAI5541588.1 guanylate cyclase protein [Trichomonas vaginalis G3]|eukprot:XP_001302627.1 Adenylate and Guanylate cyclase catalytic domain containing protein [Trichomonas vaginalis G3]